MKHRKLVTLVVAVAVIVSLVFIGCAPEAAPEEEAPPAAPEEKVIKLKYNSAYPPLHPVWYDAQSLLIERIEELTNGRVEITGYPGSTLLSVKEAYDGVCAGMADFSDCFPHHQPGQFRVGEMFMLPFIGSESAIVSPAANDLVHEFPEAFYPQFAGTRVMTTHVTAVTGLHTTKKLVKTLEDSKGMVIGGESPIIVQALKAWGAIPEYIGMEEAYLALDKGVIEGGVWPWAPLRSFKLCELLHYHTNIGFNFSVCFVIFNQEKWDSLPPDIQAVFDEVTGKNWAALVGYTLDNGAAVDIDFMKDKGDEFYTLPPDEAARWAELVAAMVDSWKADVAKLGVDGDPIWARVHELVSEYEANPYPEQDWFGPAGRYGSPRRPGGWD